MDIRDLLTEALIKESITSIHDVFEIMNDVNYEILSDIKNGQTTAFDKINPHQYRQALKEFVRFKDFPRFPTKYIFVWKTMVTTNAMKLDAYNTLNGHGTETPDSFLDIFGDEYGQWLREKGQEPDEYEVDWSDMYEFLTEVYNLEAVAPKYTNGHDIVSDYGLQPILELVHKMAEQDDPGEILVSINRILDVTHPRSDLAELFIHGGSSSLDDIAGFKKD